MPNEININKMPLGAVVQSGTNAGRDGIKTPASFHDSMVNPLSTGVITQFTFVLNTDTTKVDIGSLRAVFFTNDYDTGIATLPTIVDYAGATGVILNDVATNNYTYIGLQSNGNLTQQNTVFTTTQKKTIAPIGVVFHPSGAGLHAKPFCTPLTNTSSQVQDLFDVIGVNNIKGNRFVKGTGNFNITKQSGESFVGGANATNFNSVNRFVNAELTDTTFYYSYRKPSHPDLYFMSTGVTDIDLTKYDDGSGTLASLTGVETSIQRGYFLPNLNIIVMEYGQVKYADFNTAQSKILDDINSHIPNPSLNPNAIRVYLIGSARSTSLAYNEVLFRQTNGSTGTSGSTIVRSSLNRLDSVQTISPSVTNVIDPVAYKFIHVVLDANMVNMTATNLPLTEGYEITIMVDWHASSSYSFTLDSSLFVGGAEIGMPASTGTLGKRDWIHCKWNNKDQKFNVTGKASTY